MSAAGSVAFNLSANGGVSLGPRVAVNGVEVEAVSVDGTVTLSIPVSGPAPFKLGIVGTGKIVDAPVSEQSVTYTAPAQIDLKGKLDLTFGGYGAQLSYGEGVFISPDAFNLEAAGAVNLFGVHFAAQAVYSSIGFAVCFGPPQKKTGFGKRWLGGDELTTFTTCDVGPFRAQATAAQATAAQAGQHGFTVEPGRRMTVIAAKGAGAPPKIVVSGPGERVETPAGPEAISRKDVLLVQDPERDTTFVVLFAPRAGRWNVSGAASIRVARGLPPLKVSASVRRGVLRWRTRGLAGQRIQLVERAHGLAHPLITTRRSSGRLRFTPDPRLGARRTIEAIAYNGATPRRSLTVARFRVTPPPRPSRVRAITLKKGVLRWRAQPRNVRYEVALALPDGTTRSLTARRARLKPARLPRTGTLGVSILAVNAVDRLGPVTRASFKLRRSARK